MLTLLSRRIRGPQTPGVEHLQGVFGTVFGTGRLHLALGISRTRAPPGMELNLALGNCRTRARSHMAPLDATRPRCLAWAVRSVDGRFAERDAATECTDISWPDQTQRMPDPIACVCA